MGSTLVLAEFKPYVNRSVVSLSDMSLENTLSFFGLPFHPHYSVLHTGMNSFFHGLCLWCCV